MPDPQVKHIESPCLNSIGDPCKFAGFVQVVIVDDPELQKKIDKRAMKKLHTELKQQHEEGLHDKR